MIVNLLTLAAFFLTASLVMVLSYRLLRLQYDPIRERLAASALAGAGAGRTSAWAESLAGQLPQFKSDNGLLDQDLRRAGYYSASARQDYLALRNALVLLAVIVTGAIVVAIGPERQRLAISALVVGLIVTSLCWAVPRMILRSQGRSRVVRIRRALPDALDMISMCLTGGLTLHDALAHVSREIYFAHPDLAVELLIVRQQADMTSLENAFQQLSHRIDAPEVNSLSALITHGYRLGTDVVSSIREFADTMRLKRRSAADERAGLAGVRMLFPLVFCLLPSVFIILWGPAILELYQFFRSLAGPTTLVQ